LIQQGFMMRTSRGRVATRSTYHLFGLNAPSGCNGPKQPGQPSLELPPTESAESPVMDS